MISNSKEFYNIHWCLLGALVGDAVGAILEFCHENITEEKAQRAMTIPGGELVDCY